MDLTLNANLLADSLKSWIEPIGQQVIVAAQNQVKADMVIAQFGLIASIIIVIACIMTIIFTIRDDNTPVAFLSMFVALIFFVVGFICLNDIVSIKYAPEYRAIENIRTLATGESKSEFIRSKK